LNIFKLSLVELGTVDKTTDDGNMVDNGGMAEKLQFKMQLLAIYYGQLHV